MAATTWSAYQWRSAVPMSEPVPTITIGLEVSSAFARLTHTMR